MLYEGKKKRKRVFQKLSRHLDDDYEEKPEDLGKDPMGGDVDLSGMLPPGGTHRDGSRDHTLNDPFVEELESKLFNLLSELNLRKKDDNPHKDQDYQTSRAAGGLGAGSNSNQPPPVSKVPVLGHANNRKKGNTEQDARRQELDVKFGAGETGKRTKDDNKLKNKDETEVDNLEKELDEAQPSV